MKGLLKFLKPFTLARKQGLSKGLFGGSNAWLLAGAVAWVLRGFKKLIALGDPKPVYTEIVGKGERIVLVHEEHGAAKRKKLNKKAAKAEKRAQKLAARS